jgi:hypothetical protein
MKGSLLFILFVLFTLIATALYAQQASSILVLQQQSAQKLEKRNPRSAPSITGTAAAAAGLEQIQYRGYFINLQSDGQGYGMQVYTLVNYGNLQINSIYATQFQSSVEYAYSYDKQQHAIRQDHFLFPANSLTGWANPDDYMLMRRFDWKEKFPAECTGSIYTSEEFGREYMETSCFRQHDAALTFAQKFINYVLSRRGL